MLIVYKLNCFCEISFIGQTLRNFNTQNKEHLPACISKNIREKYETLTITTKNPTKRFSIAELLINNKGCAKNYQIS